MFAQAKPRGGTKAKMAHYQKWLNNNNPHLMYGLRMKQISYQKDDVGHKGLVKFQKQKSGFLFYKNLHSRSFPKLVLLVT